MTSLNPPESTSAADGSSLTQPRSASIEEVANTPSGLHTAECVIYAESYGDAIEQFGQFMDRIYGPKWKLTKSHAYPHVQIGSLDTPNQFTWQWDMRGEWLGL